MAGVVGVSQVLGHAAPAAPDPAGALELPPVAPVVTGHWEKLQGSIPSRQWHTATWLPALQQLLVVGAGFSR